MLGLFADGWVHSRKDKHLVPILLNELSGDDVLFYPDLLKGGRRVVNWLVHVLIRELVSRHGGLRLNNRLLVQNLWSEEGAIWHLPGIDHYIEHLTLVDSRLPNCHPFYFIDDP